MTVPRLASVAVAAIALFLSLGMHATAQTAKSGTAKLVSVTVSGSNHFTSGQIAAATGLHPGSDLTRDDLQAGADRLAALGSFATVQFRFTSIESGVKVEYQVTDAPSVPVAFDDFPWFTDEEITDALKTSVVLFDGTAPEHGTILDAMTSALEKLLETRGVHANVSHTLILSPGSDQRTQQFRIEGAGLKVEGVQFSDDLAKNDRGIQDRLSDLVGKPFSRSAIDLFEIEQVRPVYFRHAFLRVQFGRPQARFQGNPNKPLPDTVVVIAPIDPGPPYSWSGVSWTGNLTIPSGELDKFVELKPGEVADGIKIKSTWEHVRDAYARRGYLDATLTLATQFDDKAARVAYSVKIAEGPQYHMGNLVLTGLSIEAERRIRKAWNIAPGAVFDESIYEQFLSDGIKQAFMGVPVHYDKIGRYLEKKSNIGTVDVMLDFQ
ncbi:MAG: POTRA domain-containing protein [Candidatus Acidiferrales bacterium]